MLCRVSPTMSLTVCTSQPAQSCDMNCRIFSIWSWSAPPTRYTNCAYADRSTAPREISPPAWNSRLNAKALDLAMIVLSRSKNAAVGRATGLMEVECRDGACCCLHRVPGPDRRVRAAWLNGGMPQPDPSARPSQVTVAGWAVAIASVLLVFAVFDSL